MTDSTEDWQELLGELAAAERSEGDHLTADELVAYQDGELPAAERERAQGHLAACPDCTALLLDLEELRVPSTTEPPASEIEVAAVWRDVRERANARTPPVGRPAPRLRAFQALAASLLLATLGLSAWVLSLEHRLEEISQPQVNVPVVDLRAALSRSDGAAGSAAGLPAVEPGARLFTLVVTPASRQDFAAYEATLTRAGGARVWHGGGLAKNRFGSFSLTFSRHQVGPGEYRLELTGVEGGRRELLGEYTFAVKAP
ncbi:MAG TPA: zf-HC2 domain-containing protein [Thermoanaerobaculia bacterium]|nr:zf-HC2 domain-containing protein [Thermoanaerobaculia bacterium]